MHYCIDLPKRSLRRNTSHWTNMTTSWEWWFTTSARTASTSARKMSPSVSILIWFQQTKKIINKNLLKVITKGTKYELELDKFSRLRRKRKTPLCFVSIAWFIDLWTDVYDSSNHYFVAIWLLRGQQNTVNVLMKFAPAMIPENIHDNGD